MRKSLSCIACVLVGGLLLAIPGCGGGTAATGRDNGNGGSGNGGGGSGNGGSSGGGGSGLGGASVFMFDSGAGGTGTAGAAGAGGAGMTGMMKLQRADPNVPIDTQNKLLAGGADTGGMTFLYPYDQTVFPGGILAPLIQWTPASGSIDAVYVHIQGAQFIYDEIFAAQQGAQLPLPQDAFDLVTAQAQGKNDPVTVQLTTSSGGTVSGPITQHWIIARGQLNSAIYYNTYGSPQIMPADGAVMRILPKAATPEVFKTEMGIVPTGPCYSCHSLSADGQTLVAQRHHYVSLDTVPYWSESYDLKANAAPNPMAMATTNTGMAPMNQADQDWGFSAVYPDGSLLLTDAVSADSSASTGGLFPFDKSSNPGMLGVAVSKLVNPRNGAAVTTNGLIQYAKMPSFSPNANANGGKVVFNDFDNGQGHSLSVMDFNGKDTFSNRVEIFKDPNQWPGWPFITPDDSEVIFTLGQATASDGSPGSDFATVQDPPAGVALNHADLYVADLSTHTARLLSNASGANLQMRDQHSNYYPTISPVQAGGYFWVFFTSKRTYGNVQTVAETDASSKKIWVAAIDIEATDGKFSVAPTGDPSHPAFFLPGQELKSGNIRAFATLTPCKADDMNNACTSPLDCCGGHCIDGLCKTPAVPPMCAMLDEKCASSDDCCKDGPAKLYCIGGHCGIIVPK